MSRWQQSGRHLRAVVYREAFEIAIQKTVAEHAGSRGLTETDLALILRGSDWGVKPIGGVCWSFGTYDFRMIVGGLVRDGVLIEIEGQKRGGGIETRYSLGTEKETR